MPLKCVPHVLHKIDPRIREKPRNNDLGKINKAIVKLMLKLMLKQECKQISAAELVSYMEKQKSPLRKLKRGFYRRQKHEEARRVNHQFNVDVGR